jgi:hypothetical protein
MTRNKARKLAAGAAGIVVMMSLCGAANAGDLYASGKEVQPLPPLSGTSLQWEAGGRYWYSTGRTHKDLYGTANDKVSALTWSDVTGHTGELYFRGDLTRSIFIKGYAGIGGGGDGNMKDEDFPPLTTPYSSTKSKLDSNDLEYASIDLGYTFYDTRRASYTGPASGMKLGGFVGYHYWYEQMKSYGCTQTATNPDICAAGNYGSNVNVHTQETTWNSLRLGIAGDFILNNRLKLTAEAAYLPYVDFSGVDHHNLRADINPLNEDGTGTGVQVEGVLTYQLTSNIDVGVGGRYWHVEADGGKAHFEEKGGTAQPVAYNADRYGVFVQGGYKFGRGYEPLK